jgi:hypothetical protein
MRPIASSSCTCWSHRAAYQSLSCASSLLQFKPALKFMMQNPSFCERKYTDSKPFRQVYCILTVHSTSFVFLKKWGFHATDTDLEATSTRLHAYTDFKSIRCIIAVLERGHDGLAFVSTTCPYVIQILHSQP